MHNEFSDSVKALFRDNCFSCWECGQNGWDCGHHILGRISSSPYNFAPLHNDKCHLNRNGCIGAGDIHTFYSRSLYLKKTRMFLSKVGYRPNIEDLKFLEANAEYYREPVDDYSVLDDMLKGL